MDFGSGIKPDGTMDLVPELLTALNVRAGSTLDFAKRGETIVLGWALSDRAETVFIGGTADFAHINAGFLLRNGFQKGNTVAFTINNGVATVGFGIAPRGEPTTPPSYDPGQLRP